MVTHHPRIEKSRVARRFGRRTGSYDVATPVQAQMANKLVERARQHITPRGIRRILELGCGTGRMTRQLAGAFPEASIVALDISGEMIGCARKSGIDAEFVAADAERYVCSARDPFDLIISNAAIQWFENVDQTLEQAHGLLASDGLLLISSFGPFTFTELSQAFAHAYAATGRAEKSHVLTMRSIEEWRQSLPAAEISEELIIKHFSDVRHFLRSIQDAGAVNSMSGRNFLARDVLREMGEYYSSQFAHGQDRQIPATYHALYLQLPALAEHAP